MTFTRHLQYQNSGHRIHRPPLSFHRTDTFAQLPYFLGLFADDSIFILDDQVVYPPYLPFARLEAHCLMCLRFVLRRLRSQKVFMKKYLKTFLSVLLAAVPMTGCEEPAPLLNPEFSVDGTSLEVPADGGVWK